MFRVTFVVTNIELVIVHPKPFALPFEKKQSAGEGGNSFRSGDQAQPSRCFKTLYDHLSLWKRPSDVM